MFNSQKMNRKSLFLSLLVLFLTTQTSALKCYQCFSDLDKDCIANPEQAKFEVKCLSNNSARSTVFEGLYDLDPRAIDYQCATALYTNVTTSTTSLARGCLPKHVNDLSVKIINLTVAQLQVEKIRRCNSELCNNDKA